MTLSIPVPARIERRQQEAADVFSLWLRPLGGEPPPAFTPGQFNMLGLHGTGEVPISIVEASADGEQFMHTIRAVGRVTRGLAALGPGEVVGLRGPYGRGWPLDEVRGRDLLFVTGGLGCAPVLSAITHALARRGDYGSLSILQGVRHAADLIWRERYEAWERAAGVTVLLAADLPHQAPRPFVGGTVVELFERLAFAPARTSVMMCGPEVMMQAAIGELLGRGLEPADIWLSLERNMHCGGGLCGHCQLGPRFVCRDGPVFRYADIADWFGVAGL
jgi:NAD(P)H-flavin reductase